MSARTPAVRWRSRHRIVAAALGLLALTMAQAESARPPSVDLSVLEPAVRQTLEEAVESFERALASATDDADRAEAWGRLGMTYQAHHLQEAARHCYQQAVAGNPDDFRWQYYLGYLHQELGEYDLAISRYELALAIDPDYLPARVRAGRACLSSLDLPGARAQFLAVLAAAPGSPAALAGLGQTELQERQFGKAIQNLRAALQADPDADRLYYPLAMAYRESGQIKEARASLARSGDTEPALPDPILAEMARLTRSPQMYLEQGYAAARAGRIQEAVAAFRTAVDLDPNSISARLSLGQGLILSGDLDHAMTEFERVLEQDPGQPVAHYRRGTLLEEAGDDQAAAREYQLAVDGDPDYVRARLRLANALARLNRHAEAAAAYAATELPGEQQALVRYREGLARLASGDCVAAMSAFETALSLKPDSGEIYQALARVYATCTDEDDPRRKRAVDLADELFRARPDEADGETLAMAFAANDRWDEAVTMQERVLESSRRRADPYTDWKQRQLERYRNHSPAEYPWPPGHPVFLPARLGVGHEGPADR